MKKNIEKQNNQNTSNVEFGMEFGDLNASKQYEIPFMNKKNNQKKNK